MVFFCSRRMEKMKGIEKRLSLDAAKQRIRKGGTLSVEAKVMLAARSTMIARCFQFQISGA